MRALHLGFLLPAIVLGCSATAGSGDVFGNGTGGATSSGGGVGSTAANSGSGGGLGLGAGGSGDGGGEPVNAEVFANSPDTLFRLDPLTKLVTTVGPFSGCNDSVIDIALDKDGAMFGTTFSGLFKIDKLTAKCSSIASGSYPNSLSFVPKGTVDPGEEALVGYLGATYTRIDTVTGKMTSIGSLSGGYASSGDVVSVIGGGTYLTVNGNGCGDCIIQIDPKTGSLVKMIGSVNHSAVFGLAFWGGVAYGFDATGELFQIDLTTAATTTIALPNPMPNLVFWGAGSTTSAPLQPPK